MKIYIVIEGERNGPSTFPVICWDKEYVIKIAKEMVESFNLEKIPETKMIMGGGDWDEKTIVKWTDGYKFIEIQEHEIQ
jgi:trans-2-enoyl-CoA reductase